VLGAEGECQESRPATRKVIEELIAAKAISAEGVRKFVCEALI